MISYQSLLIVYAYLLDLILGDPAWLPHPVRGMGKFISFVEERIRALVRTDLGERVGGMVLLILTVLIVYGITLAILSIARYLSEILYLLVSIVLAYTTISSKGLYVESMKVVCRLLSGDVGGARSQLSSIVGRDTEFLSDEGICRALIETIAENTSDGVIAPLFYLAIGGVPLAMVYKVVNTLDSMVGYRNERYLYLGWASARADDILNYIPARVTAIIMGVSAFIIRLDWRGAFRIMLRDGRRHPSPNAGFPEAAVAGGLRVRLGGGAYYSGVYSPKPHIGDSIEPVELKKVFDALKLMHLTSLTGVTLATLVLFMRV